MTAGGFNWRLMLFVMVLAALLSTVVHYWDPPFPLGFLVVGIGVAGTILGDGLLRLRHEARVEAYERTAEALTHHVRSGAHVAALHPLVQLMQHPGLSQAWEQHEHEEAEIWRTRMERGDSER